MAKWRRRISRGLFAAAGAGVAAGVVGRLAVGRFFARERLQRTQAPQGISILKPLAGVDPGLAESLEIAATMPYAPYELLLGVKDTQDAAFPLASALAQRYPHVSVHLQDAEVGFNPKVNQLITLARVAQYDLMLISDASSRPGEGYLDELSAIFEDPAVGCVTNPISGIGAEDLGATMNSLQMASVGTSQIAASELLGTVFVVGGSQAMRRSTLAALGGFEAYANILAEDHVFGRDVAEKLGQKVVLAQTIVWNFGGQRTVAKFADRFARWSIIQASSTMMGKYAALGILTNPIPFAALGWLVAEKQDRKKASALLAATVAAKVITEWLGAKAMQVEPMGLEVAAAIPLKDAILFGTWARGFFVDTVDWRGNKLKVTLGSKLVSIGAGDQTDDGFFQGIPRAHLGSASR